jgi:hypothetical protein
VRAAQGGGYRALCCSRRDAHEDHFGEAPKPTRSPREESVQLADSAASTEESSNHE